METQRKQILKQLEEKQVKASKEGDETEVKLKGVNKILDQLKAGKLLIPSCSHVMLETQLRLSVSVNHGNNGPICTVICNHVFLTFSQQNCNFLVMLYPALIACVLLIGQYSWMAAIDALSFLMSYGVDVWSRP